MSLINAEKITKGYGDKNCLDAIDFSLGEQEKVGLIGVNGCGKSTFLKILAGLEEHDDGKITMSRGLVVQYLPQHPEFAENDTVLSAAMGLVRAEEDLLYREAEAKTMLTKLGVTDFLEPVAHLSGGQRKRLALVRTLLSDSDVLLLDEPTNHLDAEMASWLEDYLKQYRGALILITHDRYFLDLVTNRIVELDKGQMYSYSTNYSGYLALKAEREEMQLASERKRQSILRTELAWMQRGARARSTKQKARIERFEEMSAMSGPEAKEELELRSVSSRMGRSTIELEHVSKAYRDRNGENRILINDFTYSFLKNDRVGIIGRNGCGKTTLFRMLTGCEQPDSGTISIGQTVKIGYYAQELNGDEWCRSNKRVIDFIRDVAEYVQTPDGPVSASVMLEQFLFSPDKQYAPVSKLSGGEKRRLQLLKVLMEAPNVLLLDEPTNDLDIATLNILEQYLDNFDGIVIVISHDRYFLDRTIKHLFAYEDCGVLRHFMGGYTEYRNLLEEENASDGTRKGDDGAYTDGSRKSTSGMTGSGKGNSAGNGLRGNAGVEREQMNAQNGSEVLQNKKPRQDDRPRFSYAEGREYQTIDAEIADLEAKIAENEALTEKNASNYSKLSELSAEKERLEELLEQKMDRWMYLNELAERIAEYENSKK